MSQSRQIMQSRQMQPNAGAAQNARINELRGNEQMLPNQGYAKIQKSASLMDNHSYQHAPGSHMSSQSKMQKFNGSEQQYPALSIQGATAMAAQQLHTDQQKTFRSPMNSHKKKSIGSVGSVYAPYPGTQGMDHNLERGGGIVTPGNILNLASRSSEKHKRRKHVSPNHRYQNNMMESEEAEMLELLGGPSSPSKHDQMHTFDNSRKQQQNMGHQDRQLIYDARDLVPVRLGSANDQGILSSKKQSSKTSAASNPDDARRKTNKHQKMTSRAKSGMKAININLNPKESPGRTALQSESGDQSSQPNAQQWAFSVYVRVRPHKNAQKLKQQMVQMKVRGQVNQILQVIEPFERQQISMYPASKADSDGQHSFLYEGIFSEAKNNLDVFQTMLQPLIPQLLEGYNVTCFAYGQTGSGKTHTMLGQFPRNKDRLGEDPALETDEQKFERLKNLGISNLAIQNLFYQMYEKQGDVQYNVRVSYLEIYNEQVHDLLADLKDYADFQKQIKEQKNSQDDSMASSALREHIKVVLADGGGENRQRLESFLNNEGPKNSKKESKKTLKIVEDPQRGVIVQDLLEIPVEEASELMDLIMLGNMRRCVAPTGANKFSSRSHAILIFNIEGQERLRGNEKRRRTHDEIKQIRSKLQIIDLAGSERASGTQNTGQRLVEGGNINKSLMALGQCINILAEQSKRNSNPGLSHRSKSNNVSALPNSNQDSASNYQSTPNSPKTNLQTKRLHVPYRDSKLTRLLKDSLGGSTKTVMIACISQLTNCYEETMNTLKYASAAKSILNKKKKNELIHQEYSREYREEQMRRLAEIAEQEKQERLRKEEEIRQQIAQAKIPITSPTTKLKPAEAQRPNIEVPQKLKREIEKISVINLGKLESKLTSQKLMPSAGTPGGQQHRRSNLINLLQQQLIPNIVLQYNLRHQIQSNQILMDFQRQSAEQSEANPQKEQMVQNQMKELQASLSDAQETQNKIQNSILSIFDQLDKQSNAGVIQPTKPSPPAENPEQARIITQQSEEITMLKEGLAQFESEIQRIKAQAQQEKARASKSTGRDRRDRENSGSGQKVKDELRNMEMIVNDKNVEIEMLKEQHAGKEKQTENDNKDLVKQNQKLKKMVEALEKQAATQAQKLKSKDILIESLNLRINKNSAITVSTGPTNPGQAEADPVANHPKPVSAQLSKFTNREKGQAGRLFQKQKMSVVSENTKPIAPIEHPGLGQTKVADDVYSQSYNVAEKTPTASQQPHNGHLSKKQKTLKRYLSGVRVDSIEIHTVDQLKTISSEQHLTDSKEKAQVMPSHPDQGWVNGGGEIEEREQPPQRKSKLTQGLSVRTLKDQKSLRLLPKTSSQEDIQSLSAQDKRRGREPMYPKLRQSINNTKFQRNLQPRSHSRVSRSGGMPTHGGSRSRSNLSRYGDQARVKRSYTNVGFNTDMPDHLTKNNSGFQNYQVGHASQSILLPNASEIHTRKQQLQPFRQLEDNDMMVQVQPRYGSQDESFTFQNDITERPSEIINHQLRPSFPRQNPFTGPTGGAARTVLKGPASKSRLFGQANTSLTLYDMELPLQSPPALLNTLNPPRGGGDDSIYHDVHVVQESFQSQQLDNASSRHLKIGDGSASRQNLKQNDFASAASDLPGKPGMFGNTKVGSGAIPAKTPQNRQQLSEGVFVENVGGALGPGILNVSTLSMEFASLNTKRSGQQSKMGQQIGQGLTITSLEDQILDKEYENERLRQLGFFGEGLGQSPQIINSRHPAAMNVNEKYPLQRGQTQQVANAKKSYLELHAQKEKVHANKTLQPGADERLFHLHSVQQLPLHAEVSEKHSKSGYSVPQLHLDTEGAYESRTSLPVDGGSHNFDFYVSRSGEQEIPLSSKIVTPEPKHQQIIFKSNMEPTDQQIAGSARAQALGFLAQNNMQQPGSRHSHTQSKADPHNIIKNQKNRRDFSIENQSMKSLLNMQNAAASGQKTTNAQKHPFGQRFKEMLNLAEVRKFSKERRNTNQFVQGLVANFGKLTEPHVTSQREISNQILIVDTHNHNQSQQQRGPHTDNGCSPIAADISDSEDSLNNASPSTKLKQLNFQNQNDLYKSNKQSNRKHPLQKDHSSQRLQQFVDDNNKKLEEILKMAEKIEMRSVESHRDGDQGKRRSRSLRKHSLSNTENVRRKQKERLSDIDIIASHQPPQQQSSQKLGSPRGSKMTLAGPRSWAERGNLQASGGDTSEKQH